VTLSRPVPKQLSTPLSAAILSRFAIFRRSARPSDVLRGLSSRDGELGRELGEDYELSAYYPAYVRRLARLPNGHSYFVVPAYARSEPVLPAHCLAGGAHARRKLIESQRKLLAGPVDCIVIAGEATSPPEGCESFAAIDEGGRVFRANALTKMRVVELAPDGVASVRILYREAPAIAVPVSNNAFSFTPPPPTSRVAAELQSLQPALVGADVSIARRRRATLRWDETLRETDPARLEWLDRAGEVVRIIYPPVPGGGAGVSVGGLRAPIGG
jgi:hypothetical protein